VAFVRKKTFRDREFLYWVESYWKDGRSHQRVLRYLGPADDEDVKKRAEALRTIGRRQKQRRDRYPAA